MKKTWQERLAPLNKLNNPYFMRFNKKYDMMLKDGELFMFVYLKEEKRTAFKKVREDKNGFKFEDKVIYPEYVGIEDAGRNFGLKPIQI